MTSSNNSSGAVTNALDERRIWIDGCFDFAHHGHAGAMKQARQHGDELYVGVHNDEDILLNKGPPVMNLSERMAAVEGCRWCTKAIPNAPYVTDPKVMDKFKCKYVVHGDDITTDKDGKDCYAEVKEMGRFIVVKRTPNISTTDLVGRMLLFTRDHHMLTIDETQWNDWFTGNHSRLNDKKNILTPNNVERYEQYATGPDAKSLGVSVHAFTREGKLHELVKGLPIDGANKIIYVDGGFDLFNPGHILFLKEVRQIANERKAIVLVGLHDDETVNQIKGVNYPIMNLFERSLCVLQSKYIDGIILGSPFKVTREYLRNIEETTKSSVINIFHGPRSVDDESYDDVKELVEFVNVQMYKDMNVASIVNRVIANREAFEERQRRKGWKAEKEKELEEIERSG